MELTRRDSFHIGEHHVLEAGAMTESERDSKTEGQIIYDAFISYRHVDRDRKWAEWLIGALERYRLPKSLQDKGYPPRLQKIFRDEDEVPASADLNDQIKQALIASRFLIVVCSAFTPRSKWVEREIEMFNELGRGDQVLALLTEGEPSDSFPNAMLVRRRELIAADGSRQIVEEDKEPLAADVRPRSNVSLEKLKQIALLRLVAVIVGVKFDELRERERQRERRRLLSRAAAAAMILLLVGGGAATYWQMTRPTTSHYRQVIWRWAVPEGLGPIDDMTRSRREAHYAVVTRRLGILQAPKVVEVRHQRGRGTLAPRHEDDTARWVINYGDSGRTERIDVFDAADRLLREEVFDRIASSPNKLIVRFKRGPADLAQTATQKMIVDPIIVSQRQEEGKTEITQHELTFDPHGFVYERRFQNNHGDARRNAQDSFGEHLTYSPSGLVLRRVQIGPRGNEITLKNGERSVTFSYDSNHNVVGSTIRGADDRPIVGGDGYASYVRKYDQWGNDIETIYQDADGKATFHREGFSKVVSVYDNAGNNTEAHFYGIDGKPVLSKFLWSSVRRKFDDRGNVTEEAFFGLDGKPALHREGIAVLQKMFDDRGNIIQWSYFGVDGKPTRHKDGYAVARDTFDARGNTVEQAFFGVDSKPTRHKDGYALLRFSYDERGNVIDEAHFGVDGKPTLGKGGYSRAQFIHDRGNVMELAYFGIDGKPAPHKDGYALVRKRFDDRGNVTLWSYFGADGKPTLYNGYAVSRGTFDDRGNMTEVGLFRY